MKRFLRCLRDMRANEDGSPMIELAFAAPFIAFLAMGIIEFGMMMMVTVLLESGLRDAARWGITGQVPAAQTRMERITEIIEEHTLGLVDIAAANFEVLVYPGFSDVGKGEAFVDGNGNGDYDAGETFTDTNGNGVWDADMGVAGTGGSGDVVLYKIAYDWPLLTPLLDHVIGTSGTFALDASIAVRNEPW
jgi:hypothetical protein